MISAAIAGFKLLGFWGSMKHLVGSAFQWAVKHPAWALCIALALWGTYERLDAVKAWGRATEWKQAHDKLIKASDEAKAAQVAQDRANIGVQTERNKEVNHDLAIVEAARRDAVRDYAAANRCVMRPQGDQRPASAPGLHPDPQGAADTITPADMVAVTPKDLDTLAAGAMRGAVCTGFLNTLVDEGLAVGE